MSDDNDIEGLAGEYVLSTLESAERASVAARRQQEPLLNNAIIFWERRLAPLLDLVTPITPPTTLLPKIEARIEGSDVAPAGSATIIDLRRRLARWRVTAIATSALAACLAMAIAAHEFQPRPKQQNLVAVLQKDAASPAFLVTVNVEDRVLTVRPVAAKHEPGKSYELWIVQDSLGAPRSLGVIDDAGPMVRPTLAAYKADVIESATFAVSLEPEGGSPNASRRKSYLPARSFRLPNRRRIERTSRRNWITCSSKKFAAAFSKPRPERPVPPASSERSEKHEPEITPMSKLSRAPLVGTAAVAMALSFGALTADYALAEMEKTIEVGGAAMYPSKNIVENAVNSKDHTTLVAAVKAAGLVSTLEGKGPFTVFAPTNAAFDKLPQGTVPNLLKPENKTQLTNVLTYHVVAGRYSAKTLAREAKANGGKLMLKTVEGEQITIQGDNMGGWWVIDSKGDKAKITIADVNQSNGVIHVIDGVLLPN